MNSTANTPVLTEGSVDPCILQCLVSMYSHDSIFSGHEEIDRPNQVTQETLAD